VIVTPHDGTPARRTPARRTPARRTTVVTDGDLPTRLLAFLEDRVTATSAGDPDLPAVDPDLVRRLRAAHADALPGRLAAIGRAARAGDTRALAADATALAGSSGQLGDPAVARLSGAVAREARRGVVAHALVAELTGSPVAGSRDGQATNR
jgi:HPt (histidine-containing phosphotransfer) domain-containing protein